MKNSNKYENGEKIHVVPMMPSQQTLILSKFIELRYQGHSGFAWGIGLVKDTKYLFIM